MGLSRPRPRAVLARCGRRPDPHRPTSAAGSTTGSRAHFCPSVRAPTSAMAPRLLPASPMAAEDVKDHALRDMGEAPVASASTSALVAAVLLASRRSDLAIGGRRGAALSSPQACCGAVCTAVAAPLRCVGNSLLNKIG
jgi:hypothetical protein